MKQSNEIDKVAAALVAAQKEMGNAVKDSNNPFFKSKYADLLAIREAILPITTKHGLSVLQLPAEKDGKNYIETVVMHESGQFLSSMDEVVVSKQNDPQSKLAAQTYTRRGSLQSFFNIGCEDDDGNTAAGKTALQASSKPAPAKSDAKPSSFGAPAQPESKPEVKSGGFGGVKAPARSGSFGG